MIPLFREMIEKQEELWERTKAKLSAMHHNGKTLS